MMIRRMSENDYEGIKKLVFQVHQLHLENRPDIYNDVDPFDEAYFDFILKDEKTIAFVMASPRKLKANTRLRVAMPGASVATGVVALGALQHRHAFGVLSHAFGI